MPPKKKDKGKGKKKKKGKKKEGIKWPFESCIL